MGLAQLEAAGSLDRLGDAGPRMLLRIGPWNADAVQNAAANVEARRRHRRGQLAQMVAYAESNACRRRILLDHFGDGAAAEAAVCCDNCQQRAAERERATSASAPLPFGSSALPPGSPAHTAVVILDAIRHLKWEIGKEKLAQLLRGSQAKEMRLYSYDRSPYYGRLAIFSIREVGELIDQLMRRGYIKVVGGEMPVLKLTPKAEAAIRDRVALPLRLPREIDPQRVAIKQVERQADGTVALTAQLAGQGLVPAEIAARGGLTESGEVQGAILSCVQSLSGQLPRSGIAKLLVGSKSTRVGEFRAHPFFGTFSGWTRQAVLGEVDRLIETRVLAVDEHGKVVPGGEAAVKTARAQPAALSPTERAQRAAALGEARSLTGVPELIAALTDDDGNVRLLAASALGKIGDRQAVKPLMGLLARETQPQVRQYAVKALGAIGDERACTLLEQIASSETEQYYTGIPPRGAQTAHNAAVRQTKRRTNESIN